MYWLLINTLPTLPALLTLPTLQLIAARFVWRCLVVVFPIYVRTLPALQLIIAAREQ